MSLHTPAPLLLHYFSAPASRVPTFAPPDFETNEVSTGIALATMSGLGRIYETGGGAFETPPADPAICDSMPDVPTAPPEGAALSSELMPGTAFATCENSSGLSRDFATPNSAPAAPAA